MDVRPPPPIERQTPVTAAVPNSAVRRAEVREVVLAGEDGSVAFEYALVTAAIAIPLLTVVFYLLRVVADMYGAQMMILNLPFG